MRAKFEDDFLKVDFLSLLRQVFVELKKELPEARVRPWSDKNVPFFVSKTPEGKREILHSLKAYLDILLAARKVKYFRQSNSRQLWAALKGFGLTPPSDLLNKVRKEDIVEIYCRDNIQIWFSLSFMEICSYSLEELFCNPWNERYSRDPGVNVSIIKDIERAYSSDEFKTVDMQTPPHRLQEIYGYNFLELEMECGVMAPLRDASHSLAGFVCTTRVKLIKEHAGVVPDHLKATKVTPLSHLELI